MNDEAASAAVPQHSVETALATMRDYAHKHGISGNTLLDLLTLGRCASGILPPELRSQPPIVRHVVEPQYRCAAAEAGIVELLANLEAATGRRVVAVRVVTRFDDSGPHELRDVEIEMESAPGSWASRKAQGR
jgi:hypothetical protein